MGTSGKGLKALWLKGSAVGLVMQGIGMALAFASSVLLARVLGAGGLGRYGYVLAIVSVLAVFAAFGVPTMVARLLVAYRAKEENGLARGLLRWAGLRVTIVSVLLALALAIYGKVQGGENELWLYLWAAPLIPLLALTNLRQRALQALHHPILAQLPEQLAKHAIFLAIAGILLWLGSNLPRTAEGMMALWVVAVSASLGIGWGLLRRFLPVELKSGSREYRKLEWSRVGSTLLLADGLGVILGNSDTILLGLMRSSEEVGLYQVALRLSGLMLVLLGASNWVLAPWFAKFHALEDRARFQSVVTRSGRAVFLATLGVFLLMVVAGRLFLAMFFGPEFQAAYPLMLILGVGQLVNVASGPVVNLLAMAGGQRELVRGVSLAAASSIVLCLVLIPKFGALGAALSVAVVTSGYNLLLAAMVNRRVGIRATILG